MTWHQLFQMLDRMPDAPTQDVQEAADDLWTALSVLSSDDLGAEAPRNEGGSRAGDGRFPVEAVEPDESGYIPMTRNEKAP